MVNTEQEVLTMFGEGFDCSQIVLSNVCDKLGITKEDIREWIQDAVEIEVKKIVDESFSKLKKYL